MVVFRQSGCILEKCLYSGKSGCIQAKVIVFGQSGCIRQSRCIRAKWL